MTASAPAVDDAPAELAMNGDGHDRMTVPVNFGEKAYRFLVDTGSVRTTVSRQLARDLGLQERAAATLHSATGQSAVRMAWLPELRLSRRPIRNIAAPMLDAGDMGADGILGIDSLRSQQVVFDFAHGTLSILSSGMPAEFDRDAIVVRAKRREGRLVITDAEVNGEPVSVVVDSGSSLTIGNQALRRKLERRGSLIMSGPIELTSVTGAALHGELATVGNLDIGGARLENLNVVFAEAHTFGLLGLSRKPAILLGMNALSGFDQVSIDFAGRKIALALPKGRKRGSST
jgi:Predicted aspartyl protease